MSVRYGRVILLVGVLLGAGARPGAAQAPPAVSFQPPVTYDQPVPVGLERVTGEPLMAADLDRDGRLDLAVITRQGLSILYGNGDGTFAPSLDLPLGPGLQEGTAADVNGDGLPDLVYCDFDLGKVAVLINQGGRQFSSPFYYPASDGPVGITAADFNGDGQPDLAVSCHLSGDLVLLLNRGDGTFLPPVSLGRIGFPGGVISGDFNGDGHVDLAETSLTENVVRILLGDGTGRFKAGGRFPSDASYANRVVTADLNGDGIPDLAVACQSQYAVLFGDGQGGFGPAIRYPGYPLVDAGDFDGDGAPDLVAPGGDGFSLYLNRQAGNFLPPQAFPSPGARTDGIVAGDFNGDGRPDVVTWNESSPHLAVFLNNTPQPSPAIRSLSLDSTQVIGGCQSATGTVTLTAPAPAQGAIGGVVVLLASSSPAVIVPAELLIPEGALQARFSVLTTATAALQRVSISASFSSSVKRAVLAVQPMGPPQLTINPAQVIGGQTAAGQVTMACPAGPAGVVISLSSSSPLLSIPASVTVPPGATTAAFPIGSSPVATAATVTIHAGPPGAAAAATLQLLPPFPPPVSPPAAPAVTLTLFPNPVSGGQAALGEVTLAQPAGPGGVTVTLASSNPALAAVPASVAVPSGTTTASFLIVTFPVGGASSVVISAGTATATLALVPLAAPAPPAPPVVPAPTDLTARVLPGFVPAGTVQLTWQDNSGGQATIAVWRRPPGGDWTQLAVLSPGTTSYLDPNLAPGVTYTYRLRAFRGGAASDWSNEASATALLLIDGIPYGPTGLQETLAASFTQPDGGVTVNLYQGYVLLHVTGVGQAYANVYSDAFYLYSDQFSGSPQNGHDGSYYQLAFAPSPLGARDAGSDARNYLVGPLPPYNPAHEYTVVLNTRLASPGTLHFGVSDAGFSDNTGAYVITVTQLSPLP